jgi:hypothetical protein
MHQMNVTTRERILAHAATVLPAQPTSARRSDVSMRLTGTVTQCRIDGYEWFALDGEDTRYCLGCLDILAGGDEDYIAQHIVDSADRTNRTEATVKRHWREMVKVTPVAYRLTYRLLGSNDARYTEVEVPRAMHDAGYRRAKAWAEKHSATLQGKDTQTLGFLTVAEYDARIAASSAAEGVVRRSPTGDRGAAFSEARSPDRFRHNEREQP